MASAGRAAGGAMPSRLAGLPKTSPLVETMLAYCAPVAVGNVTH